MSTETKSLEHIPSQSEKLIEDLRNLDRVKFLKQYPKGDLVDFMEWHEIEFPEEDTTKAGLYEAICAWDEDQGPDADEDEEDEVPEQQGHKRSSDFEGAVAYVWQRVDAIFTAAKAKGKDKPRRRDVTNQLIVEGVAYHTARTQYQAWHKHTDGGRYLVSEGNARPVKRQKQA